MDLLDSILRKAKAESLTEKFKENGIEASTLSLLTDKDLQLLGIEKPEKRQDILKCIANLQIPKEKRNELLVNEEYVLTVLHCISQQLLLHYASLSYAMTMENVILCDVKLSPATKCLVSSVENLEQKINDLKELVNPTKKRTYKNYLILIATTSIPLCLFLARKFTKIK